MEPPPRKDKLSVVFKKLQIVHTERLSRKNQLEIDFVSKIKGYCKQRSQLELEYGLALQRLSNQSQTDSQTCEDMGYSNRSLYAVWNSYLEDCTKVGKQHQSLSNFYAQNMGENLRALHASKTDAGRKCLERLGKSHHYIQLAVKELERTRKDYNLARSSFEEATNKADVLKDKLQKKGGGIFQSRDQLEKEYDKISSKRDEALRQTVQFRNMYLIQVEAVRNHQEHYRNYELTSLIKEIEQGMFDQVWTYLSAVVAIEKENYETITQAISTLSKEVEQILSPDEHHSAFLNSDRSLRYPIQVEFEPCLRDSPESSLVHTRDTEMPLVTEARKWVMSLLRHRASQDEARKKLGQLEQLQKHAWEARKNAPNAGQDAGMQELQKKIDEWKDAVRRGELMTFKAEALVDFFRKNGLNVDEMMVTQERMPKVPSTSTIQGGSIRSRDSIQSQASSEESNTENNNGESCRYLVLYDYQAQQEDELSLTKGEVVILYEDPTDVSWPKGENSSGHTGLIPSNYVQVMCKDSSSTSGKSLRVSSTASSESPSSSLSSPGRHQKPVVASKPVFNLDYHDRNSVASADALNDVIGWCEAVLDYEADNNMEDEICFMENDLIGVLNRDPHGVDDGWWSGVVLRTGQTGSFLALMTQELTQTQANEKLRRLHPHLDTSVKLRDRSVTDFQDRSTWCESNWSHSQSQPSVEASHPIRKTHSFVGK